MQVAGLVLVRPEGGACSDCGIDSLIMLDMGKAFVIKYTVHKIRSNLGPLARTLQLYKIVKLSLKLKILNSCCRNIKDESTMEMMGSYRPYRARKTILSN